MNNPTDYCPDDTICACCGKPLPEDPKEGTLAWEGFCSEECRTDWERRVKERNS